VNEPQDKPTVLLPTDQLIQELYGELRRVAAAKVAREPPGQTLQATALVHEAWLRLKDGPAPRWHSRAEFFSAAAEAMRRTLIDRARRKRAARHGGKQQRVDLDDADIAAPVAEEELLMVHEALDLFAQQDPQKAELVKLRYFAGLTLEQIAEVLNVSLPTAKRHWSYARLVYREISRENNRGVEPVGMAGYEKKR
jgi:RNA polymerase sigma factor (TIGR02999 family)